MSKESEQLFRQHDTSIDTNRRDLLQTLAAAGLITGVGAGTAAAGPGDSGDTQGNGSTDEKPQRGRDLFVDPDEGNDDWEGNQPEPVGQGKNGNGPLKTVQTAIDRARKWASQDDRDTVNVWFREGRYDLDEAAVVEPFDEETAINFFAYPDEQPVLDGGRRITGWEETEVNGVDAWVVDVPDVESGDWDFRQLFINGERRQRSRLPKGDDLRADTFDYESAPGEPRGFTADVDEFLISEENLGDLDFDFTDENFRPKDVEMVQNHIWASERYPVESFRFGAMADRSEIKRGYGPVDLKFRTADEQSTAPMMTDVTLDDDTLDNASDKIKGVTFTVGDTPIEVTALARYVAPGNNQTHPTKLLRAKDAKELASVSVDTSKGPEDEFRYVSLDEPVQLQSNTTYILATKEFKGGDQQYSFSGVNLEARNEVTLNGRAAFYGVGARDDLTNGWYLNGYSAPEARLLVKTRVKSNLGTTDLGNDGIFFENVPGAIKEPGEWYLDRENGELYYVPKNGETKETTEAVAPEPLQLLRVNGCIPGLRLPDGSAKGGCSDEIRYVSDLTIRGLTFQYAGWDYISNRIDLARPWDVNVKDPRGKTGGTEAAQQLPGVIKLRGVTDSNVEQCTIRRIGYYGMELDAGCRNNTIRYNLFEDVGAGGLWENGGRVPNDYNDISESDPETTFTKNNLIADNRMKNLARVHYDAVGIFGMHSFESTYTHNHISDCHFAGAYLGIAFSNDETEIRDRELSYNIVDGIESWKDDDGLRMVGRQPGTVIKNNYLTSIDAENAFRWDGFSREMRLESNIIDATKSSQGLRVKGGEHEVINNIIYDGPVVISRGFDPVDTTYQNNLLSNSGPIFRNFDDPEEERNQGTRSNFNLFWRNDGNEFVFDRSITIQEWQDGGFDTKSIVSDPQFVDPDNGDFSLEDGSPAFDIGFEPIDISKIGIRGGDDSTGA